ncbi:MAG: FAD-dependent oxidoreductase [Arachnia propionica]|nr:MAG: FAD-dependent oxidoreductase [Arachnia propionica]
MALQSGESKTLSENQADVVVVGAGPGGSSTAAHLANRGLDVILLEKSRFPRDKVCGDGLTPRGTRALTRLGIDTSEEAGWLHNKGLRIHGGKVAPFELDWPTLTDYPPHGLTSKRADFDLMLAQHAESRGVRLVQEAAAKDPILDEKTGRIVGVTTKQGEQYRAPIVVAADGRSSRLAVAMGRMKRDDRPMGVAVRTYYRSPRSNDNYLDSWLELWDGKPHESALLPGYGWIFGMGDGTSNVGLGVLSTSKGYGNTDYRQLLKRWLDNTPEEWGFRDENQVGKIQGAALPMAFNRVPAYGRGLVLVGDAGGMVNPFNGEGIPYAMDSGEWAADHIAEAKARGFGTSSAERVLHAYHKHLKAEWGGYYRLGTVFVRLIGDPRIMRLCTTYGLPIKPLMRFLLKFMSHLTDETDGDISDRVIHVLETLAPAA